MTLTNLNPYRTGEVNDPMLAYFSRLEQWDAAKHKLFEIQSTRAADWPQGELERQGQITMAEVQVQRAEDAANEMKAHAACVFRWMKGVAEKWFADDLFADPEPQSTVLCERAIARWKADVLSRAAGMAEPVTADDGRDVIPLWKRGKA